MYDIYYLDPQHKSIHETSDEFASRVQLLIAEAIGKPAALFDGSVWYKETERAKYRNALKEKCSWEVAAIIPSTTSKSSSAQPPKSNLHHPVDPSQAAPNHHDNGTKKVKFDF